MDQGGESIPMPPTVKRANIDVEYTLAEISAEIKKWENLVTLITTKYLAAYKSYKVSTIAYNTMRVRESRWTYPKKFFQWLGSTWHSRDTGIAVVRAANGHITAMPEEVKETVRLHHDRIGTLNDAERQLEQKREQNIDCIVNGAKIRPYSVEELGEVFAKLSKSKAPGVDLIPNEIWEGCAPELLRILPKMFTQISNGDMKMPASWGRSVVSLIYKKNDPLDPGNYRPISLICTIEKIYTSVLNNRLNREMENSKMAHETQFGFRKKRSTDTLAIAASTILSRRQKERKNTHVMFLDVSKAFDTVHRAAVWKACWTWVSARAPCAQ